MTEPLHCDICSDECPSEDLHHFGGRSLCQNCFDTETVVCERCGERVWISHAHEDDCHSLCRSCFDDYYTTCSDCGAIISNENAYYPNDDDDTPYCCDCCDGATTCSIHSYSYKPDPIFYGEGSPYLGVELEIDNGGEDRHSAKALLKIANQEHDHLYCKHDGSLSDGFELVSHPMTFAYHTSTMPWENIVKEAISLGYSSHKARTCGLHVHVNRNFFGAADAEQDNAIARVLYFVENHWPELLRFSRRTEQQLQQWASRYGRKDNPKAVLDAAKKSYARYTCVNLTNYATIEFRIFRGTLKYNTLIATLQLVSEICKVAALLSDEAMDKLSWTRFVEELNPEHIPELIQYLKERRLYINEIVTADIEEES